MKFPEPYIKRCFGCSNTSETTLHENEIIHTNYFVSKNSNTTYVRFSNKYFLIFYFHKHPQKLISA